MERGWPADFFHPISVSFLSVRRLLCQLNLSSSLSHLFNDAVNCPHSGHNLLHLFDYAVDFLQSGSLLHVFNDAINYLHCGCIWLHLFDHAVEFLYP